MADNDSTPDESADGAGTAQDAASVEDDGASSGEGGSFLSRFGGGFATIAGGAAAFVLMLAIGGFVAFQLLGGPGDGAAPGPISADGPSSSQSSDAFGSGSGSGSGSNNPADADPDQLQNPDSLVEPNDQDDVRDDDSGNAPDGAAPADFELRISKAAAEPYENVVFRGSFPRPGRTLLLQNKVGADWVDYREDVTVKGDRSYRGTFSVGAVGVNEFRVVEPRTGQVSNVVSIEIY